MQNLTRALPVLCVLVLAGCATAPTMAPLATTATVAPVLDRTQLAAPAEARAVASAMTDVSSFIDAGALSQLTAKSKTEAAGAQFNALQYGRVGAPRNWVGDNGQSGAVTVGPYVRVNLIDCRDFTHTVTIGSQNFVRKGTACREADGRWTVSANIG